MGFQVEGTFSITQHGNLHSSHPSSGLPEEKVWDRDPLSLTAAECWKMDVA